MRQASPSNWIRSLSNHDFEPSDLRRLVGALSDLLRARRFELQLERLLEVLAGFLHAAVLPRDVQLRVEVNDAVAFSLDQRGELLGAFQRTTKV